MLGLNLGLGFRAGLSLQAQGEPKSQYGSEEIQKLILDKLKQQQAQVELGEIIGCFEAANAEGLYEAIAGTTDERLKDLLERRIMHAYHIAVQSRRTAISENPEWLTVIDEALVGAHLGVADISDDYALRWQDFDAPTLDECELFCAGVIVEGPCAISSLP